MKRNAIKLLSNKPVEFVPAEYKDMDVNAEDVHTRPFIYITKRMSREDRYEVISKMKKDFGPDFNEEDITDKDKVASLAKESRLSMSGESFKHIWDTCVLGFKNAIFFDADTNKEIVFDETMDKKYVRAVWNGQVDDAEVIEVISFILNNSTMGDEESKNSLSPQDS